MVSRMRDPERQRGAQVDVKIKAAVEFTVSDSSLEDALAEFDELTVESLLREVIDKAVACDDIKIKVEEGPNTLEEFDQIQADARS